MMQRVAIGILVCLVCAVTLTAENVLSAAVLEGNGTVYINGQQLRFGPDIKSMPVTPGDIVEIKGDGTARVNGLGFGTSAGANTILRLQSSGISLDRGTLLVGTGNASSIFTRDFKITPVSSSWTQFSVTRSSGTIQILALKNDVTVACGTAKPITVKEGQQLSREDAADCGLAQRPGGGAATAAHGPILASPTAKAAALAAGGGLAAWSIVHGDDPVSPSVP